jgi:nucleoside-diphosphate-sugar epimerase
MIYITGSSGLIGKRFLELSKYPITKVSYRDEPQDVFDSHENSCLLHLAWSSLARNTYDEFEKFIKNDVINSKKIFDFYSKKNPNGKIIFISTAGGLYVNHERTVDENSLVNPNTLYGDLKLQVENILKTVECNTLSLRVSNVWGGKSLPSNRINGLVDKLLSSVNTDNVIDLYTNFDTRIDIIHVDDLVDLIEKCIEKNFHIKHDMFVIGSQSLTIKQLLDIVTSSGYLNLKLSKKQVKSYLHVEPRRALNVFDWKPKNKLI